MRRLALALAVVVLPPGSAAASEVELAPGVRLLAGAFVAGTQPDGNTVVFSAPAGLVVFDAGRHVEQTRKILALSREIGAPIAALVNSHWHLDHSGGDVLLRREVPGLKVWASDAVVAARAGFLADYRAQLASLLEAPGDEERRAVFRAEMALIDAGQALVPDEVIARSGPLEVAGKQFEVLRLGPAVTKADVALFDPESRIVAAGDLVTLPAPLLDTACAPGWSEALGILAGLDFALLVPGHGAPLSRSGFDRYRAAYDALLACAATDAKSSECIDRWFEDAGSLLPEGDRELARGLLDYYIGARLRAPAEERGRLCAP